MKTKVAVVLIALLLILVVVLFCQIFNVRNIEIKADGALPQSQEELISKSGIELNSNIFSLSKEEIRSRVESSYQDRSVAVDRIEKVFPNTVRIYIRLRTPLVAIELADGTGVVPTDRDFQLTEVKDRSEVDYGSVIAVKGATVAASFDTNELIYLRRVLYAFFRSGFDETSLREFLKEFRFETDGLHAVLRKEENAEMIFSAGVTSYDEVVRSVRDTYDLFLKTGELSRANKIYTATGAAPAI